MDEELDRRTRRRAEQLRRIAREEIRRHRERHGYRAAALDGSLATGALWPSSDLDFTLVPLPGFLDNPWVEWGQCEGIPWHKHLTFRRTLLDLMDGYPESFIHPAQGGFNADANWQLDGLATMAIMEDPEGLLAEVKAFVSARRFDPSVWEGRREGFLAELRHLLAAAREALDRGVYGEALQLLCGGRGFASVAGHVWLESARRIYSSKEQDGNLKEVARERGCPQAHSLYREAYGADEERAKRAAPLIYALGERTGEFYAFARRLAPGGSENLGKPEVWEAWVRHLAHRMSLAAVLGHPAHIAHQMSTLRYDTQDRPLQWTELYGFAEVPGAEALLGPCEELDRLFREAESLFLGPTPLMDRAEAACRAAESLMELTEKKV